MSTTLGSEPAFPLQVNSATTGWSFANHGGLTKRELLAGIIAAGQWSNAKFVADAFRVSPARVCLQMGSAATEAADALLLALQSPPVSRPPSNATPEPETA